MKKSIKVSAFIKRFNEIFYYNFKSFVQYSLKINFCSNKRRNLTIL